MDATTKERSARWRDRRRIGAIVVTVEVLPKHRRAFESMGLIAGGYDADRQAVCWAVSRFLDAAPAVASIGTAIYPNVEDFMGEEECDALSNNSGQNEG